MKGKDHQRKNDLLLSRQNYRVVLASLGLFVGLLNEVEFDREENQANGWWPENFSVELAFASFPSGFNLKIMTNKYDHLTLDFNNFLLIIDGSE